MDGLAHVTQWDPYELHALANVMFQGLFRYVLFTCRSCLYNIPERHDLLLWMSYLIDRDLCEVREVSVVVGVLWRTDKIVSITKAQPTHATHRRSCCRLLCYSPHAAAWANPIPCCGLGLYALQQVHVSCLWYCTRGTNPQRLSPALE